MRNGLLKPKADMLHFLYNINLKFMACLFNLYPQLKDKLNKNILSLLTDKIELLET